jgi:NadR type nicotinamide-nucleotide adenylyltransferase
MKPELIRIAVIGPESTGKTTLCGELADLFNTTFVPEYARGYIAKLNRRYTKADIIHCAEEQLKEEEKMSGGAKRILFCDTELIIIRVWLLDVFGECPEWIDESILKKKYDLYLVLKPDIPFIKDPVRENPHRREFFFDWYKTELEKRNFPYEIISGTGKKRVVKAKSILEKLISRVDKLNK